MWQQSKSKIFLHRYGHMRSPGAGPRAEVFAESTGSYINKGTDPPDTILAMIELTVKNTAMPTMSSRTAIGRSVSVTGPLVWNS
jgi:hypothetical protein